MQHYQLEGNDFLHPALTGDESWVAHLTNHLPHDAILTSDHKGIVSIEYLAQCGKILCAPKKLEKSIQDKRRCILAEGFYLRDDNEDLT